MPQLYPYQQDEEFFRLLKRPSSTSKNAGSTGVKLNTLQSVLEASPVAHALSIVRRSVSSYFVAAFVAGFVALVVSTLAPAARASISNNTHNNTV